MVSKRGLSRAISGLPIFGKVCGTPFPGSSWASPYITPHTRPSESLPPWTRPPSPESSTSTYSGLPCFFGPCVPPMIARRRGALILMSSLAGNQGSPSIAVYAASKAFNKILAESLWKELKPKGIDVIACCAGAVRTPGFAGASGKDAPGTMDPASVAGRAVAALGRGPVVVPGFVNKLASFFLGRLLSKRMAIGVMANSTKGLS